MKLQQRNIYIGLLAAALAALLLGSGTPLLFFLETARTCETVPETQIPSSSTATVPETQPPTVPTEPALPVFSAGDLQYVTLLNSSGKNPPLEQLLTQPLQWQLTGPEPTVLIIHTHGTESYTGTAGWRSTDPGENMVSIGAEVARVLEAGGIRVLHDRTLYDDPRYVDAYSRARQAIRRWLEEYPSIQLVLDLHRDASEDPGNQLITSATVGGQSSAQLMMVIGADRNSHWQENLALGLKLTALLEQYDPGIGRPVQLRPQRFNMDLCPGSLLVEVGAAGNTRAEALIAANALAQSILLLSRGTQ